MPTLTYPSSGGSALISEGHHLYLIGGLINEPFDKVHKGFIDYNDPGIILWTQGTSIPVEMNKVSAGYIGNGEILATDLNGTFMYDISTDLWTVADNKPIPVKGGNFVSVEVNNAYQFAVAGGKDVDENIVDHVEYFPADENTRFPATFMVNFFSGGPVINAEIQVASYIIYTDDTGSAVQFLENGTYDYTAEFDGLVTSGSFTIDGEGEYIDVQLPVSINEISSSFTIYPNPSNGKLQIEMENSDVGNMILELSVVDLLGKPIYNSIMENSGKHGLNLSHLNRGVYFVILSGSDNYKIIRKLVID